MESSTQMLTKASRVNRCQRSAPVHHLRPLLSWPLISWGRFSGSTRSRTSVPAQRADSAHSAKGSYPRICLVPTVSPAPTGHKPPWPPAAKVSRLHPGGFSTLDRGGLSVHFRAFCKTILGVSEGQGPWDFCPCLPIN